MLFNDINNIMNVQLWNHDNNGSNNGLILLIVRLYLDVVIIY